MRNFINFFIKIGELKKTKRRGWVMHGIKHPESTADHIFRVVILSWLLNKKKKLDEEKVLKIALVHDICEVYAGDETPYDPLLPEKINLSNRGKIKKILKKWPNFSPEDKKKKASEKYKRESEGINKLISRLPPVIEKEIRGLWANFEKGLTKEGRFVYQVDKAENFLQGLEYWKEQKKIQHKLWDRWGKEIFDDPVLLEFKEALDKKFFKKSSKKSKKIEKNFMDMIVDFMIELGKLKRLKRKGWLLRGIKDAETVSQHTFRITLMAWLFGRKRGLDIGKVLKTSLVHDFCQIYTGYETPHEPLFFNFLGLKRIPTKKAFKKPHRLAKTKRIEWLLKKKKKEWLGLEKLISGLPKEIREEITNLWVCFDQHLSREGRFVNQVNKVENLLQATEYWLENKKFPIAPWWIEIKEIIDDTFLLEFIKELEKKYYQKN